jgi:hypothetical protein
MHNTEFLQIKTASKKMSVHLFRLSSFWPFRLPLNLMKSVFVYKSVLGQRAVKKINRSGCKITATPNNAQQCSAPRSMCIYCIYLFVWEPPGSGLLVLLQCSVCVLASHCLPACHPPSATELCNRDRRCDRQFAYIALERRRGEKATNSLAACTHSGSLALISSTAKLI